MKRDLELIKKLLEKIELVSNVYDNELEIEGYESDEILFHIDLLIEAGYVKGNISQDAGNEIIGAFIERLSWEGYEFLELTRNNTIWEKSKKILKEKSVGVPFAILTELLKLIVKDAVGISNPPKIN